jgi:hypothetical protein
MTQPQRDAVKTKAADLPKTDWEEVRRRRERTENLIERMKNAQDRLERAVDRVISKNTK